MKLSTSIATQAVAPELVALHNAVAEDLTSRHGHGVWSSVTTLKGMLFGMRHSRALITRSGKRIVGTLHLQTKKPWAIDVSYFTPVKKALYLTRMAVTPAMQRRGIGRLLLEEAAKQAEHGSPMRSDLTLLRVTPAPGSSTPSAAFAKPAA